MNDDPMKEGGATYHHVRVVEKNGARCAFFQELHDLDHFPVGIGDTDIAAIANLAHVLSQRLRKLMRSLEVHMARIRGAHDGLQITMKLMGTDYENVLRGVQAAKDILNGNKSSPGT